MNSTNEYKHDSDPAERLWKFLEGPDSKSVADRYEAWARTPAGIVIMSHLHAVAALRAEGLLTKAVYNAAMMELASKEDLPLADLLVMAEGAYEVKRCYILATGTLAKVAGDWQPLGGLAR